MVCSYNTLIVVLRSIALHYVNRHAFPVAALTSLVTRGRGEQLLLLLDQLSGRSACDVQPFAATIVRSLPKLLALRDGLPNKILLLTNRLWLKLNTIMPRK